MPGRSVELAHGHHLERAQSAVLLLERYVLARNKGVIGEAIARIVVAGIAVNVVVEGPRAARLMDDVPHLVCLPCPKPAHPAPLLELFPHARNDAALVVEGRYEIVALVPASARAVVVPR